MSTGGWLSYDFLKGSIMSNELFEKTDRPVYKGSVVYRDMADNLAKVKFPVIVTEAYNPNIHYSLLREGAPPPIYTPGPNEIDARCDAMLTGDFIIDALVNGQFLEFKNPEDMDVLADWIDQFLKSYQGIDLTRYPDRAAFNANAKRALEMLRSNLLRKEHWEQEVNPRPLSLAEIIAYM